MQPSLRRKDLILSAIIGEFSALVILFIGKNIGWEIPYAQTLPVLLPALSIIGLYISYLVGKKIQAIYQLGKFILVGITNTLLDLAVLNVLIFATSIATGFLFSTFKGISFIVAVINSYFWNKFWTFQSEKGSFLQFFIISVIGFFINVGVASLVVAVGPYWGVGEVLWANIGALIATMFNLVWNFLGYKFIVFKE